MLITVGGCVCVRIERYDSCIIQVLIRAPYVAGAKDEDGGKHR
jgi:hypothetical protein